MKKTVLLALLALLVVLVSGCSSQTEAAPEPEFVAPLLNAEGGAVASAGTPSATAQEEEEENTSEPEPSATRRATRTTTRTPRPTRTASVTRAATETRAATKTPLPAPTGTNTPNASGEIVHTVAAGETIYTISAQYGVLWSQLTAYNSIAAQVEVGQEIRIPVGMMSQRYVAGGGRTNATPVASSANENRVVLGPVTFDWQKLNNCGPTTTSVLLSYYGINQAQLTIAASLKPNANDKNVSPAEVASYVRRQGLGAFVGVNGNIGLLERLLAAGYPVMVEQWMQYDGGVGHYRAVRGYDRDREQVLQEDTFLGPDIWRSYGEFNRDWAYFNNTYIVFYPAADEARVAGIIGGDWNRGAMWQRALETFRNQSGALALYGQAEALHQLGNDADAVALYEQAINAGLPARYFWYRFGYFEALNNLGRYQRTLEFSEPILKAMGLGEDIRYHRAVAYKALGQTENARRELRQALQDNANYGPASALLNQLPPAPPTWTPTAGLPTTPVAATPTPGTEPVPPTSEPVPPTPEPVPPTSEPVPPTPEPTPEPVPPTPEPTPEPVPPTPEPTPEPVLP
nr:C39 family peptidase [Ardenticatenales bacterium]